MTDVNGFRVNATHDGYHGPDIGPTVWVIRRDDNIVFGVWPDRHSVVGAITKWPNGYRDRLEPVPISVGSFRFNDVKLVTEGHTL